jgi:hypothetical protein
VIDREEVENKQCYKRTTSKAEKEHGQSQLKVLLLYYYSMMLTFRQQRDLTKLGAAKMERSMASAPLQFLNQRAKCKKSW